MFKAGKKNHTPRPRLPWQLFRWPSSGVPPGMFRFMAAYTLGLSLASWTLILILGLVHEKKEVWPETDIFWGKKF